MALSWSNIGLARDVAPPGRIALIGAGAGTEGLKLTLHALGTHRPFPSLAGGRWPFEDRLQLDSPLSVGFQYLHLALTGGSHAGWLPFLGTSTSSLGGLRIRF